MSKTASFSCIYAQLGEPIRLYVSPWVIYKSDAIVLVHKKVAHTEEDIVCIWLDIIVVDNGRDILNPFARVFIIVG